MTTSAVIPAYNEENTIGAIIDVLMSVEYIDEITVVSDGSIDATAAIARGKGINVIELPENLGKGAAMKAGLDECTGDVILFLDADLIGLTAVHVQDLLKPVLEDETDMTIGLFSKGRISTDIAHKISPHLSGQRAVRKQILDGMKDMGNTGYGVEIALTKHTEKANVRVMEVELKDLTHVMKEEKLGLLRGFRERLRMYWQIYRGVRLARRQF